MALRGLQVLHPFGHIQFRHAQLLRRAITLDPQDTCIPGFTRISHSGPSSTSTREPTLIMPTRSPGASVSPTFLVKTMRRAIKPAIVLMIPRAPSPSQVTEFDRFY